MMIIKEGVECLKYKIKYLREALGLSQAMLAQKLNITQSTVAMWEIGENSPRADKLPQIAKVFGCTIDELFNKEK